jgi:hypothetical protein
LRSLRLGREAKRMRNEPACTRHQSETAEPQGKDVRMNHNRMVIVIWVALAAVVIVVLVLAL